MYFYWTASGTMPKAQRGPCQLVLLAFTSPARPQFDYRHLLPPAHQLLLGDPKGPAGDLCTHLRITDSAGHILYSKEDATKGNFAFTTEDYDMFEVCFESKGAGLLPDQLMTLDMNME